MSAKEQLSDCPADHQALSGSSHAMVPLKLAVECVDRKAWLYLYVCLGRSADADGRVTQSIKALADASHISGKDVRKALAWLNHAGWIQRIKRPGQVSEIKLLKKPPEARHLPPGGLSTIQRYQIFQRDGHRCVDCGASPALESGVRLEIDHRVPHSMGGSNDPSNLQTLCWACNNGKRDAIDHKLIAVYANAGCAGEAQ